MKSTFVHWLWALLFGLFSSPLWSQDRLQTEGGITAEDAIDAARLHLERTMSFNQDFSSESARIQFEGAFNASAYIPLDFKGAEDAVRPVFYHVRYNSECKGCTFDFTIGQPRKAPELLQGTWVVHLPLAKRFDPHPSAKGGTRRLLAEIHVDDDGQRINRLVMDPSPRVKINGAVDALTLTQSPTDVTGEDGEDTPFRSRSWRVRGLVHVSLLESRNQPGAGIGVHVGVEHRNASGREERALPNAVLLHYTGSVASTTAFDLTAEEEWTEQGTGWVFGLHWNARLGQKGKHQLQSQISTSWVPTQAHLSTALGNPVCRSFSMETGEALGDLIRQPNEAILTALDAHTVVPLPSPITTQSTKDIVRSTNLSLRYGLNRKGKTRAFVGFTWLRETRPTAPATDSPSITIENDMPPTASDWRHAFQLSRGLRTWGPATTTYTGIHIGLQF